VVSHFPLPFPLALIYTSL